MSSNIKKRNYDQLTAMLNLMVKDISLITGKSEKEIEREYFEESCPHDLLVHRLINFKGFEEPTTTVRLMLNKEGKLPIELSKKMTNSLPSNF